ncbi:50S ribosomal protein L25/general stress protein Ctc [Candidatus Persebacteraceae bacterium Df01]|jgi:large subunit ribosomal protein L25|uniref:Large ribosomal subunit protein bL25 n=1 Tax=Candidatus Doriopsillibacter californiensis TaxID=2970740 RepID=A0ABT7QNA3_9GAMM|nr:50S ribosomal protein L25/general stress protein Ctc [Candidatus Persebacteraceae bacterium Df01]
MEHIVEATHRKESGRGVSRALRRNGRVPGILYGGDQPVPFSCAERDLVVCLQEESFHFSVLSVKVDGKGYPALLREVQRHPVRRDILHVDFQAVRQDREIAANVPLHFINAENAPGVKLQQGIFTAIENQVSVHCLPAKLPEYIEVDVIALEISKSVHLSDIVPPDGVRFDEIVRGNNPALATITGASEEEVLVADTVTESEDSAGS